MVRVGGMSYSIYPTKPIGQRISDMTSLKTGKPIDPKKNYVVSGWASVNEGTEGPPVYDLVSKYIEKKKTIDIPVNKNLRIIGG